MAMFLAWPPITASPPGTRSSRPLGQRKASRKARRLDWKRLSAAIGIKGLRLYYWAYAGLADIDASDYVASRSGFGRVAFDQPHHHRSRAGPTWAPAETSIEKLVRVEGYRWAIEDSFEMAKNELGLDHKETRSWHGWNRHVSLVMLAFAMMATIRCRDPPKRRLKNRGLPLIRWSIQEIRRIATRKGASSPRTSSPGPSGEGRIGPPPGAS